MKTKHGTDPTTHTSRWTLPELTAEATRILSWADVRQPNKRITRLPSARTARFYTRLGLLDRPLGFQGRVAQYGPRHLLQLVAIKGLQAGGASLETIQRRLLGATDAELVGLVQGQGLEINEPPSSPQAKVAAGAPPPSDFWSERPGAPLRGLGCGDGALLRGLRLSSDAVLWLDRLQRSVETEDIAALRAAAAPLLKVLVSRRLLADQAYGPGKGRS